MLPDIKREEVLSMIKNGFITNAMAEPVLYGAKVSLSLDQITDLVNSVRAQAVEEYQRGEHVADQPY
jgi:hypothetical protein